MCKWLAKSRLFLPSPHPKSKASPSCGAVSFRKSSRFAQDFFSLVRSLRHALWSCVLSKGRPIPVQMCPMVSLSVDRLSCQFRCQPAYTECSSRLLPGKCENYSRLMTSHWYFSVRSSEHERVSLMRRLFVLSKKLLVSCFFDLASGASSCLIKGALKKKPSLRSVAICFLPLSLRIVQLKSHRFTNGEISPG